MERKLISSGSTFENEIGYSRAVVAGQMVFVSGTTGFNYQTMSISSEVAVQAEQAIKNIESALMQAGATLKDVVKVTYILPEVDDFEKCWPILRNYFSTIKPAATMFVAKLADERMKIEIEVTAIKQQ